MQGVLAGGFPRQAAVVSRDLPPGKVIPDITLVPNVVRQPQLFHYLKGFR